MTDNNRRLVGQLQRNSVDCIPPYFIIHKEALCGKMLQQVMSRRQFSK